MLVKVAVAVTVVAAVAVAVVTANAPRDAPEADNLQEGPATHTKSAPAMVTPEHPPGGASFFVAQQVPTGFRFRDRSRIPRGGPAEGTPTDSEPGYYVEYADGEDIINVAVLRERRPDHEILDVAESYLRNVHEVDVRGHRGIAYEDTAGWLSVKWVERPELAIQVNGRGVTEADLLAVAESLIEAR